MQIKKLLAAACAAVMAAGVMGTSVTASAADSSEKAYREHKYRRYDHSMTWQEADRFCRAKGGHLVTINSAEEQEFIEELLRKGERNSYWIGGMVASGTITWVTGEAVVYTNWAADQPDLHNSNEDALMIYKEKNPLAPSDTTYKWNDIKSDGTCGEEAFFGIENFGFICEIDAAGDINDDGIIDVDDLTLLQKFVAGWKTFGNKFAADVNCDDKIDIDDITLLQKKVAGWNVKLGK